MVVIAGTGSVAFGRSEAGEEARAGGWGPILGDEGSAYGISRAGFSAVLRAYDGRGPSTQMLDILTHDYQLAASEIPRFVYATTTHADDIARYSKLVIAAAEAGDEVASTILKDAGRELGACVVAVAQRLKIAEREFPVAYVGGAFNAGELLLTPMQQTISARAPRAKVGPPHRTPVEGAAMMAIRAAAAPRPSRSRG